MLAVGKYDPLRADLLQALSARARGPASQFLPILDIPEGRKQVLGIRARGRRRQREAAGGVGLRMRNQRRWIWLGVTIVLTVAGLHATALDRVVHRVQASRNSVALPSTMYSGTISYTRSVTNVPDPETWPNGNDPPGGLRGRDCRISESWQITFADAPINPVGDDEGSENGAQGQITGTFQATVTCPAGSLVGSETESLSQPASVTVYVTATANGAVQVSTGLAEDPRPRPRRNIRRPARF
jgi:hypothetical protein